MQNGRVGREPVREIHLSADEDRPELSGVTLRLWLLRQSDGAHLFQVRIDGTGGLCGFVEGLLEIDGNTGRFINDPDEISASRPHYPHVCEPDPQPGTIDAVLVAPFGLVLEPGGLAMSNSAGEVRFVVRND
jgi:hypothetical protein